MTGDLPYLGLERTTLVQELPKDGALSPFCAENDKMKYRLLRNNQKYD
jgi:hypothetical protein